jgi:hypothetical protein
VYDHNVSPLYLTEKLVGLLADKEIIILIEIWLHGALLDDGRFDELNDHYSNNQCDNDILDPFL